MRPSPHAQGSRIRNVLVSRTLESSVTVGILYLTNISATAGPLRVFGPRINEATLQAQVPAAWHALAACRTHPRLFTRMCSIPSPTPRRGAS